MSRPRPEPDLPIPPPRATIRPTRFGYIASYTDGLFYVDPSHFAFTRKGIERKAQRMLRSLNRDVERRKNQWEIE